MKRAVGRRMAGAIVLPTVHQGPGTRGPCTASPWVLRLHRAMGNQGVQRLLRTHALQPRLTVDLADDRFEREADRIAEHVMRVSQHRASTGVEGRLQRAPAATVPADTPPSVVQVLRSPGQPLDAATRAFMEPRFGLDFGQVRVHADPQAAAATRAIGALAYTVGQDVVFGAGHYAPGTRGGRQLLAHELAHVAQQSSEAFRSDTRIQRYEAGEHAAFGATGAELASLVSARAFTYKVKGGETLRKIASKFSVSVEDVKRLNSAKLKRWPASDGSGRRVEGFNAGETITIPPTVNAVTKEALAAKELVFTVNGVSLEYGIGISMGDFFESPEQMVSAPESQLNALHALIKKEKTGGSVSTEEWQKATGNRYLTLAEKNEAHFAPSEPQLVKVSGLSTFNHKTEWEKHHKNALQKSQGGKKEDAFRINAFGDHFLTDAFAGGHLVNKRDVMERFKDRLLDPKGALSKDAQAFFDTVAQRSFTGDVKATFSKYEPVEKWKGVFRPNIDSADRFSILLQRIHEKEPDVLANAIAKAVHDTLNALPKGVPVENAKGDKWSLSGDGTLNASSKHIGRKAVAQSVLNILDVFRLLGALDLPRFFQKVWEYVPRPTVSGVAEVKGKVESGTDPKQPAIVAAVVTLIQRNYVTILKELVARGFLRKA